MKKVFICSAVRTPIGSFGGVFSSTSVIKLGATAVRQALKKYEIESSLVNEVIMGHVYGANTGQSPARQVLIEANLPNTIPASTVNKLCASGLKSVTLAAQSIMLGINKVVIAGGMENMSLVPYYLTQNRWGAKFGHGSVIDGLSKDGLTDAYHNSSMGVFADETANKYGISREEQDAFTINSYKKAFLTNEKGRLKSEIIATFVTDKKQKSIAIIEDEEYKKVNFEKIPIVEPAFSKKGTVTAANASTINDGAAALVLADETTVKEKGLNPLAEIIGFADAAHQPEWFTTAPVKASQKLIENADISIQEVDVFEVNEAFAVVPLVYSKLLKIPEKKINLYGGAIAIGHPLGASGARILVTLCNTLANEGGKLGLATICNGGGGATAILIKKC